MSLRKKLAEFGFESNDDYDFAVRCLLELPAAGLRAGELVGTILRRKTAFAHALGAALEFPHRLYLDFSRPPPPAVPVLLEDEDSDTGDHRAAVPLSPLERVVTEACAFSESERTLLVLDQLHCADFAEQMRIFQFVQTALWLDRTGSTPAHRRNLLVLLISGENLYHSLQRRCFRVYTDAAPSQLDFRAQDFGLGNNVEPLIAACVMLFRALGCEPTREEFERLLRDCDGLVRTVEQLRTCVFGRIENLQRERLYSPDNLPALQAVIDALMTLLLEESDDHEEVRHG